MFRTRWVMCTRPLLIGALTLTLAACAAPPASTPTPSRSPTPGRPPLTPPVMLGPTGSPAPSPTALIGPTPTSAPDADRARPEAVPVEPPARPFDYIVVNAEEPRRVPNAVRTFWVADLTAGRREEIKARLRVQTEHVAMWVAEGVWHDVRQLEEAATFFENQIYPTTRAAFGSEWTPGVDNDPHIVILHVVGLADGVVGYTSSADEFPCDLRPFSNEAEMITANLDYLAVGSPAYYGFLARHLQRLIQWTHDRNEERWVKEGLAELAVRLNGLDPGGWRTAYLEQPDTSLTAWEDEDSGAHRGAAYLFATYFHERYGNAGTRALTTQPLNGAAGFNAALAHLDVNLTFEDLFADWLLANYLDSEPGLKALSSGSERIRHSYATLDLARPAPAIYERYPLTLEASVRQFAADYIVLRGDHDLQVRFAGSTKTPILNLLPHSGRYFWWSNRADESLTTLTRAFDLSEVDQARLTYWTWYDIEPGYDYATVEISTDNGNKWQILSTPSGTGTNPQGNNPGWGYTGQSGDPPRWVQQTVDLSSYSGSKVLVRFAYLTDEAVSGTGFAVDDLSVPQIGYVDDVEGAAEEWEAAGFVRTDNFVRQRYLALLIGLGDSIAIERLPLEQNQTAEWSIPLRSEGWHEAVLVLSGLAPLTREPAPYELVVEEQSSR